jgi:hypothetical protein
MLRTASLRFLNSADEVVWTAEDRGRVVKMLESGAGVDGIATEMRRAVAATEDLIQEEVARRLRAGARTCDVAADLKMSEAQVEKRMRAHAKSEERKELEKAAKKAKLRVYQNHLKASCDVSFLLEIRKIADERLAVVHGKP